VSDQDFDKMFEDAANERDFLFSTDSWDEVASMLDRNDPKRVDLAVAQGIEGASFEATEGGFESAMGAYAQIKSKRRRKAIIYWSSGALVALLLAWFALGPASSLNDASTTPIDFEKKEKVSAPVELNTEEGQQAPEIEQATGESSVKTPEPIAPLGETTEMKERSTSVVEPAQANGNEAGNAEPPSPAIALIEDESNRASPGSNKQVDAENNEPFAREEALKSTLEKKNAVPVDVAETNNSWIPQSGEYVLPSSKKGIGPEGQNDWGIIVGGRSMRLKDVPDGFDITKYSPEVGVRYARRLNDLWSIETELTGYMIAGTQGSVSFARVVYGMGEATQYRYIESDQSVQLEVPVRLRYRFGGRHFVTGGMSATYMLPTDVRITEEIEEWYGTESLGSHSSFGYVYGMRKLNISWTFGYQFRMSDRLSLNTAVNYYMLDRDLLDSEALVPIPWQIRVGVHYSLFR